MIWKLIAKLCVKNAERIIARAMKWPYLNIDGYMNRWWLFNAYKRDWLPSIRVHHILREDFDRHMHDHPWNTRTIILKGWYLEDREEGQYFREAGYTGPINFGQFHNITMVPPEGVWTIFITYKYGGTWGFKVDGVKVPYRTYLGLDEK
jgi:hypothetical protein